MSSLVALSGLFWGSFLAATILPGVSEVLLVAVITGGTADPVAAVLVAGTGNTVGSMTNWLLGRYFARFSDRRWFPVPKPALDKATTVFNRYGVWTLLLAWWPLGGDALTIVAGLLKVPFWLFVLLVGLGKFARYGVVALLATGF